MHKKLIRLLCKFIGKTRADRQTEYLEEIMGKGMFSAKNLEFESIVDWKTGQKLKFKFFVEN